MNQLIITHYNRMIFIATHALSQCMNASHTHVLILAADTPQNDEMFSTLASYGKYVSRREIEFDNHSTMQFITIGEFDKNRCDYTTMYIVDLLTDFTESEMIHVCKNLTRRGINIYSQSAPHPDAYRQRTLVRILKYLEFIL